MKRWKKWLAIGLGSTFGPFLVLLIVGIVIGIAEKQEESLTKPKAEKVPKEEAYPVESKKAKRQEKTMGGQPDKSALAQSITSEPYPFKQIAHEFDSLRSSKKVRQSSLETIDKLFKELVVRFEPLADSSPILPEYYIEEHPYYCSLWKLDEDYKEHIEEESDRVFKAKDTVVVVLSQPWQLMVNDDEPIKSGADYLGFVFNKTTMSFLSIFYRKEKPKPEIPALTLLLEGAEETKLSPVDVIAKHLKPNKAIAERFGKKGFVEGLKVVKNPYGEGHFVLHPEFDIPINKNWTVYGQYGWLVVGEWAFPLNGSSARLTPSFRAFTGREEDLEEWRRVTGIGPLRLDKKVRELLGWGEEEWR